MRRGHRTQQKALAHGAGRAGFTLLETMLAVLIGGAILLTVLVFYRQAARLRTEISKEMEFLGAARGLLSILARDLGNCVAHAEGTFYGSSNTLRFVSSEIESGGGWSRLRYNRGGEGVLREIEDPEAAEGGMDTAGAEGEEGYWWSEFELEEVEQTGNRELVGFGLVRLEFDYWSGTNWVSEWAGTVPPGGVRVRVGREAVSEDDADPVEVFQRVIWIPSRGRTAPESGSEMVEEGWPW